MSYSIFEEYNDFTIQEGGVNNIKIRKYSSEKTTLRVYGYTAEDNVKTLIATVVNTQAAGVYTISLPTDLIEYYECVNMADDYIGGVYGEFTFTLETLHSNGTKDTKSISPKGTVIASEARPVITNLSITGNPVLLGVPSFILKGKNRWQIQADIALPKGVTSFESIYLNDEDLPVYNQTTMTNTTGNTYVSGEFYAESQVMKNAGYCKIYMWITDSRRIHTCINFEKSVWDYTPISCAGVETRRGTLSNGVFTPDDNGLGAQVAVQLNIPFADGGNRASEFYVILIPRDGSVELRKFAADSVSGSTVYFNFASINPETTWDVVGAIYDNLDDYCIFESVIETPNITMDILADGTGIAFGKAAETSNMLECDFDVKFNGGFSATAIKKYVCQTVTAGGLTADVYSDGSAFCYGQITVTPLSSTVIANMYYSEFISVTLPVSMKNFMLIGSCDGYGAYVANVISSDTLTSTARFRIFAPANISNKSIIVRLNITGSTT